MLFQNNYWRGMQGPDQEAAKIIEDEKKNLKEKNQLNELDVEADAAVLRAKSSLTKTAKADDSDQIKTERLQATKKIEAAKVEFEKILALVKRKIELKANVAKIDTSKDFLHAHDELVKLEKENEALKKEGMPDEPSVAEKRTELNDDSEQYYDGLSNKVDEDVTRLKQIDADKLKSEDVNFLMVSVAELQQAKFNKYPGLDPQTDTKDYEEKIKNGVTQLDDSTAKLKDPDLVDSLKRFKFAQVNLAGAESSGAAAKESGHLAGAEQYMAMVLAEQEARRVWASLPRIDDPKNNWRGDKIGDDPTKSGQWDTNGENYKNYIAAQKDFSEALALASINKDPGDSYKATVLFKSAADKWRLVVEKADLKKETDMKEQPESKMLLSKFADVAGKKVLEKYLKPEHKALLELAKGEKKVEAKDVDGKLKEMAAATTELDKLLKDLDTAREAYGKSRIQEAFNFHFTKLGGKGDLATTVYDFMNNPQYLKDVAAKMTYITDPQKDLLLGHGVEYKSGQAEVSGFLSYDIAVKYLSSGPSVYVRDYGNVKDTNLYLTSAGKAEKLSANYQEQLPLYPKKAMLDAPIDPVVEDNSVKDAAPVSVPDKPVADTGANGAGSGGSDGGAASDKAPESSDAGTGGMPNASVDPAKMVSKDPTFSPMDGDASQSI